MLVRPFIQPIAAFDVANSSGIAIVSVLGGGIVNKINYEIYSGSTLTYSSSIPVTDRTVEIDGVQQPVDEIRNFNISLTSSMGLQNNNSYTIRVYTQNTNTNETSGYSSVQYLSCYVSPTITIKDSSNVTVVENYQFTSQSGILSILFSKNSPDSDAILNDISVNIFGIKGELKDLVFSSGDTYTPFEISYDNLLPTTVENPAYTSYTIEWSAHTVQNMALNGKITSLTCDYTISESSQRISATNDCANGCINVAYSLMFSSENFSDVVTGNGGTTIRAMTYDNGSIYVGGNSGNFSIYDKTTKTFGPTISNPFSTMLGGVIYAVGADNENVYVAGADGKMAIYNKSTGSFDSAISSPFSASVIRTLIVDEENVFIGGQGGKFAIYDKSTQTFGQLISTPFTGTIYAMSADDENIYVGGANGCFAVYNKSTGIFGELVATPFGAESVFCMVNDSENVYVGGGTTWQGNFAVYNKLTKTFGDLIADGAYTAPNAMAIDSFNVYVGKTGGVFTIYNKNNKRFGASTSFDYLTPLGNGVTIYAMLYDGSNIYIGGEQGKFSYFNSMLQYKITRRESLGDATLISGETNEESMLFIKDYYTKTNCIYHYNLVSGDIVETIEVLSNFDGAYIADGEKCFRLCKEWERQNATQNQKSVIYEPYGRKYPVVAYNAVTNYRSGTDSCMLSLPYMTTPNSDYIDRMAYTKALREINSFLTNRKPKVIKDFNGDIVIVSIVDVVGNSFVKELGNTMATVQFNWVEVGDFTDNDFRKLGITNSFKLYPANSI